MESANCNCLLFWQQTERHLDNLINLSYFNWFISFSSKVLFGPAQRELTVWRPCACHCSLLFLIPCPRAMWQYVALFRTTAGYLWAWEPLSGYSTVLTVTRACGHKCAHKKSHFIFVCSSMPLKQSLTIAGQHHSLLYNLHSCWTKFQIHYEWVFI